MESIKTVWSLLPWIALIIVGVWHIFRQAKIVELREDILDLQNEIDIVFKSHKQERTRLLEEIDKWKLLATAPVMEPMPQTIITSSDLELVACRSEIFPNRSHEKQIREATDTMINFIIPFIYTALKDENGYKTYYQELYVGTPKKITLGKIIN